MVCVSNECTILVNVRDTIGVSDKKKSTIELSPSKLISSVIEEISSDYQYDPDKFELLLQNNSGDVTVLNKFRNKRLMDVGMIFNEDARNTLIINSTKVSRRSTSNVASNQQCVDNDDENSQPLENNGIYQRRVKRVPAITNDSESPSSMLDYSCSPLMSMDNFYSPNAKQIPAIAAAPENSPPSGSNKYIGLVNQAMTCYLNSLLQALYMTPEFRNALYKWEFDGQNTTTSIPFQLQKLFLNLQTSSKSAVETTELTKSFGWDLSEAWQQHDIQELCRVMFDALEHKFKDTEQANLINALYEGKMLDYVKCLECGTEKSREDTFLDIPLPVRPFGSNVSYTSIKEALRAFVQPETLEENNQYFCEKCNKKCDAHKGLKFTKFPYLLTLHLKRFDFDYSTMHRIKLNDKVVFKEILNLNSFIANAESLCDSGESAIEERETIVKCDDSSTTDSGSALDDESCQGTDISSTVNGPEDNCQEEDEGIDVSSGANNQDLEKSRNGEVKGPYVYELFSIMIHSGSASGGHYYAYIKDFSKNKWYCFNDQSVTRITEDDIKKTYGGGPSRGYYSGAYSSSTNAYMLMYRQIDKKRNCNAMAIDEFPPHIKKLLQQIREKEEYDRAAKERENEMYKLRVYCWHPVQNQLVEVKIYRNINTTLSEAAEDAYSSLKLDRLVPLEDCRLVTFNKMQESIECSFDEDLKFCEIPSINMIHNSDTWLLEIKHPNIGFQSYKPGGVTMKLFLINLEEEEVDESMNFRVHAGETVKDIQMRLAALFNMDVSNIKLVLETYSNEPHYLDQTDSPLKFDPSCCGYKLYVSKALDDDQEKSFTDSKLHKIIDRFVHVVTINVYLPDTSITTLESMSIPSLDINQNNNEKLLDVAAAGDNRGNSGSPRITGSPQLGEPFGDQSNSEDSSLSDSDRTLVGEAPGDCIGLLSSSSNSPPDQHMSSPNDPTEDLYNQEIFSHPAEEMNWDDEEVPDAAFQFTENYYFKVTLISSATIEQNEENEESRFCKVQVDKRMTLARFKKNVEPVIGVPVEYFKVFRQYPNEIEWTRLSDTLSSLKDGDKIVLKLGRVLRKDEFTVKIYKFNLENGSEPFDFMFEWIVAKGQTVGSAKKEIVFEAKKKLMLNLNRYHCRLRKKNWKTPEKVYLDDQKFGDDIPITNNWEMFLQDMKEPEKVKNSDQLCLFVRRWYPSSLTLSPFHEVVLDEPTMDELKNKLAQQSQLPLEFIEVAYPKELFPCDMNVLELHTSLHWNPDVQTFERWPVQANQDGNVFFYRDSREPLKELTPEERTELNRKENTRLGKYNTRMSYSLRRERALKIYLDPSNKSEEQRAD